MRLFIAEFRDSDAMLFDEVMKVLEQHPDFQKYEIQDDSSLLLPGLEIYPERRQIYCGKEEIHLTVKEFDLLCLLVANKGRVLTYEQIYERVWGDFISGSESVAIRYHICNLREKINAAFPEAPFGIRCVREVGYCFEIKSIQYT